MFLNSRDDPYAGPLCLMLLNSRDDPDTFRSLTGKRRHEAHARVLAAMGVAHFVRPDGVVVVSQALVDQLLGVGPTNGRPRREVGPNWDAI